MRSVLTRDADSDRFIYDREADKPVASAADLALQSELEGKLREALTGDYRAESLVELRYWRGTGGLTVLATVRAPQTLTAEDVQTLEQQLIDVMAQPLKLVVRTQVDAYADSSGFIAEFEPPAPPASAARPPAAVPQVGPVQPPS